MALFFLTYELRDERNYQKLYKELDKYQAVRILESTWCFKKSNTTTKDLRDHFQNYIDKDDGLIVSKVDGWASSRTDGTPKDL